MRKDQIGIQLYTVREVAKNDFLGTLSALAGMGYPAVEFAGLHGHSAEAVRAHLDSVGLRASSAHVPYARFVDELDSVVAEMKTLGCEFAIVPWIGPEIRGSVETARSFVASLQEIGKKVRDAGLRFGYHNHDFEFAPLAGSNGTTMWDLILTETDPSVVELELDVYWVAYGGADPAALVFAQPERYPLLHFKDMTGSGADRKDAPIGTGTMDFTPLIATSAATTSWYIVEQDNPSNPLADAETSLRGMQGLVR